MFDATVRSLFRERVFSDSYLARGTSSLTAPREDVADNLEMNQDYVRRCLSRKMKRPVRTLCPRPTFDEP